MGLFTNLIVSVIYLAMLFIDILFIFVVARILHYKWQFSCLSALNSIGKPLVDWFTGHIEKAVGHISNKTYSQKALLVIGMSTLMLARFFLDTLFSK